MITVEEYFGQHGAGHESEITNQIRANADALLGHVNALLAEFGEDRGLRSGWRPAAFNASVTGAAKKSKHMTGSAVDIEDNDGQLKAFALQCEDGSYPALERFGLYAEAGTSTPTWLHVQCLPPGSGRRVFYP